MILDFNFMSLAVPAFYRSVPLSSFSSLSRTFYVLPCLILIFFVKCTRYTFHKSIDSVLTWSPLSLIPSLQLAAHRLYGRARATLRYSRRGLLIFAPLLCALRFSLLFCRHHHVGRWSSFRSIPLSAHFPFVSCEFSSPDPFFLSFSLYSHDFPPSSDLFRALLLIIACFLCVHHPTVYSYFQSSLFGSTFPTLRAFKLHTFLVSAQLRQTKRNVHDRENRI